MSVLGMLKSKGPSGFGSASTAEDVTSGLDLSGRNILVTGANSGLGQETARVLAARGARIFAAGRSKEKVAAAVQSFKGELVALECELAEPKSVRACVNGLARDNVRLDAIIANAGIMALPELRQAYGYELQFFTNHIGHFLLITGLLPQLSDAARVVVLSSDAHKGAPKVGIDFDNLSGQKSYGSWAAYGQSKLANLLFVKELARRFVGSDKTANAVHPGVIRTNLGRSMPAIARFALRVAAPILLKTTQEGAATQCYVATHPSLAKISGQYFADCNVAEPNALALDPALASRLWQESERIAAQLS